MKWERRVAILIIGLVLLLLVRGLWSSLTGKDRAEPVVIEVGQPFYAVYFSSLDAEKLVPEFLPGSPSVERVLEHLLQGPRHSQLVGVIPEDVRVLGYRQQGTLLVVSFSQQLVGNHPGGSRGELLTVYGIVNSLTSISGIERVQILVENEPVETLVGHVYIGEPLEKDYSLLSSKAI